MVVEGEAACGVEVRSPSLVASGIVVSTCSWIKLDTEVAGSGVSCTSGVRSPSSSPSSCPSSVRDVADVTNDALSVSTDDILGRGVSSGTVVVVS
jgi:hypothetical protein